MNRSDTRFLGEELERIDGVVRRLGSRGPSMSQLLEREYIRGKLDGLKFALELTKQHQCLDCELIDSARRNA